MEPVRITCKHEKMILPNYHPAVEGCRTVDEYDLLKRLGEGSYGIVYRARDKQTKEIFALKQLKLDEANDAGMPQTMLREIMLLMKCQNHPNIVNIREIVTNMCLDKVYIVMEYIEFNLKLIIEEKQQRKTYLSAAVVKSFMLQLLQAVDFLHSNWIMHRDLKPDNILISHGGRLKLADFGLAREYGMPIKPYTTLVTTLWYRAPELLLGITCYDTSIDIWSLGCIFGEMLLLKPLFRGQSELQQILCIFQVLGTPNTIDWPDFYKMPVVKDLLCKNPFNCYDCRLYGDLSEKTTEFGWDLIRKMLSYNPLKRIDTAAAIEHEYFLELTTKNNLY